MDYVMIVGEIGTYLKMESNCSKKSLKDLGKLRGSDNETYILKQCHICNEVSLVKQVKKK